jgi:hypothetical protein
MLLSNSIEAASGYVDDIFGKLVSFESKEIDRTIMKDIDRTIITDINKKQIVLDKQKKEKLFNILKAYSIYDPEVGYCQGTNYIIALFLINITSQRASFWTFSQLMDNLNWRDLYVDKTPKLLRLLNIFRIKLRDNIPDIYEYFESIDVNSSKKDNRYFKWNIFTVLSNLIHLQ